METTTEEAAKIKRKINKKVIEHLADNDQLRKLVSSVILSECDRIRKEIRTELTGLNPTATIQNLIEMIIKDYDITFDEFQSKSRVANIVEARQICHWLIRKQAVTNRLPYIAIGKLSGNADHSTVLYSVNKISDLIEYDVELRERVMMYINRLGKQCSWNGFELIIQ